MAHIKFKFDVLNAFCNEAFEKFGSLQKKVRLLPMSCYYQTFMELNHMNAETFKIS